MKLKILTILVFIFFGPLGRIDAQQTNIGKMHTLEGSHEISFKRSTNFNDNTTKYTILQHNSEIFEIVFQYDTEADSILIYWIDRKYRAINSRTVKFSKEDTKILISKYELNVEEIDESPTNPAIFSIDSDNQITLYQFQPSQGSSFSFELQPIPANVKTEHQIKVADYKKTRKMANVRTTTINDLKKTMFDYRDSMIKVLEENELEFQEKAIVTNDETLNARFTERMDTLFKNQFKKLQIFGGTDSFNVRFEFICNGAGEIIVDTSRAGILPRDGQIRTWFRDSFIVYIKPEIERLEFETLIKPFRNQSLLIDFENKFRQQIEDIERGRNENNFVTEIKQIKDDLKQYLEKDVSVFVKYRYEAKIRSETKRPELKYSAVGELTNKSNDLNKIEINEDLQNKFKLLQLEPGGRYTMEHCVFYINNHKYGPNIRKAVLKSF